MKKIFLYIIVLHILFSCSQYNSWSSLEKKLVIQDSDRALISGLNTPTVDYILLKDGEEYMRETGLLLNVEDDTYVITLDLISGSTYSFEEFTIKSDGETEYILDEDVPSNTNGFSISSDGVFSDTPKVCLKKVTGIVFDDLDYEVLSVEISTDESSYLEPVDLTFKVSSNVEGATFTIYKYTIYWVTGPILQQNDIFDMDTGNIFDPMIEGDDESWGNGKFKIVTTDSYGTSVFVVGFSDEWSKKHIHLNL